MRDNNLMHDIREIMLRYGHSSEAIDPTAHGQLAEQMYTKPSSEDTMQ